MNVLSNASYDGAALSVDGANPLIAGDIYIVFYFTCNHVIM